MKGLFINSKAKKCSIHESGLMIFDCLKQCNIIDFDYIEIDKDNRKIPLGYDTYLFNYHYETMNWLKTKNLRKKLGFIMTVVLDVSPDNPFPLVNDKDFDIYLAIDPTLKTKANNVFSLPRPLEKANSQYKKPNIENIPTIGTFGFPTIGKGFEAVIEAVSKEFTKAIIKINMPEGDFVPNGKEVADKYEQNCKKIAKEGVKIEVTHNFMSKKELIEWCAKNTIKCFFDDRDVPGLSATTDQAITSGAPLLTNNNPTFRHITKYIKPYPEMSIKEAIEKTPIIIKQIQRDWSQENFTKIFEDIIKEIKPNIKISKSKKDTITLPKKLKKINILKLLPF